MCPVEDRRWRFFASLENGRSELRLFRVWHRRTGQTEVDVSLSRIVISRACSFSPPRCVSRPLWSHVSCRVASL